MDRLPRQKCTKEFQEQAVRVVLEQERTIREAARRLAMSDKTLANWVFRARHGQLAKLGESRRPVTELEAEVSRLQRELAEARMERDILKKPPRTLPRRSCPVRAYEDAASPVSPAALVSDAGGVPKWVLCVAEPPPLKTDPRERTARSGDPGRACAHPADLRTGAPPGGIAGRRVPPLGSDASRGCARSWDFAAHRFGDSRRPPSPIMPCRWRRMSWPKRLSRHDRTRPG